MPVRLRITILFALVVFAILGLVCASVYYFSYKSRLDTMKSRLTNRAITTARFLGQTETFTRDVIHQIDSLTTVTLKNKVVQAYDYQDRLIYGYSDLAGDNLKITPGILDQARIRKRVYFTMGEKEVIAYHYISPEIRMVMISAAEDIEGKASLRQIANILFFCFLGGIIIAFAGGYFFSRKLLFPVRNITEEVNEISAKNLGGNLATSGTGDEWDELAVTLNQLLNRLKESFELQRRFISNASHELSTPLTSMSSQLEVSLQRDREASEYRAVMQSVLQDVQNMNKLTQTLLEFAKASGDEGGIQIALLRMDELLLLLPAEMQKQDPRFQVSLQFDALPDDEKELFVLGNHELLFTAIRNIVANACKYSTDNRAELHLSVDNGNLVISIRDKGIGIDPKDIEKIYQPFYRVDESRARPGFGLGLSLAERIIKLHKGSIAIQSIAGEGSVFTISLPAAG